MESEFIFDKAPFRSCHASTIAEAEPGKLLAAWFGGSGEGQQDVRIWLSCRDATGWSLPEVVAEEKSVPCWNPVLFRSSSGKLMLFYKAGANPMSWSGWVRFSHDGGSTWTAPHLYPAGILGPIKNKPIQLQDGTIVAGTSVECYRAWACWIEKSQDDGQSFRRIGPIIVPGQPYGIIQPTLYRCADGRIVMLCRSRQIGRICRSESRDAGETWTPAQPTELPNPNSGIDLVRTGEGLLVLVYNPTTRGRSPLSIAVSKDEGQTWRKVLDLETAPGEFSYPSIIQGQDGRLHICYTWQRLRIKHVLLDPMKLSRFA
ncbi:MAG: neuraminidase (sialidase) [Gemmataceae bacterium]